MRILFFFIFTLLLSCNNPQDIKNIELQTDVCIYGATSSGIAAAISAAKMGRNVILIEPTKRIGGLITSGLSHTDFHSFESLSGTFLDYTKRVEQYYIDNFGANSEQVKMCFNGVFGEPKVNLIVLQTMLSEFPQITIRKESVLSKVAVSNSKIENAIFKTPDGNLKISAKIFIDGSYEGDLMAMSGVKYHVGREGRNVYGESLAPEKSDNQLQAYNFRFCATDKPENRTPVIAPKGYKREDFVDILPILKTGKINEIFSYPPTTSIYKAQTPPLPNYKYDINDVSRGYVRLSMPGHNLGWPEGSMEERKQIFEAHQYYNVGLLYFLQNDDEVSQEFREKARQWGWCKDEFEETNHLPPQLYIREARRMIGNHIYVQKDSKHANGDTRAVLHTNAIAMADYGNNCHGTFHEGPLIGGKHTGEFYNRTPPYQIPYGVIFSNEVTNLLVPVAVSSSHVGFNALRLEPVLTSLGQAAGCAAALAIEKEVPVKDVAVAVLQSYLHKEGSATVYTSDVLSGHPDFEAVQWWGTLGGFHGLFPMKIRGGRGDRIHGQYHEAALWHNVELEKELDQKTHERWLKLAKSNGFETGVLNKISTRGAFIRNAFETSH